MERHSWERWTTDGEKRADEKRRGGGGGKRRGYTEGVYTRHNGRRRRQRLHYAKEGAEEGRMEEGAHLTPMEWAKERASTIRERGGPSDALGRQD